jgi:DHA3 family macrolide efflux protein-like MFS transporter
MKKFYVIWVSQVISYLGSSVVTFALAWYLTIETGLATILATSVSISLLPRIFLGPFIGPYIDRWDRKKIIIISDSLVALITAGLVLLFFTGAIEIWHIYVAMVLRSIGDTVHFPAMKATIPLIVPEKHLSRAAGLNQMLDGVTDIIGPPMGAVMMETLPVYGVLSVDIATAAVAVGCIALISIPKPVRTTLTSTTSVITDMVQGFRYIWSWRGFTLLLGLIALLRIFTTPCIVLLPVFVTEHLDGDVMKLGWLDSAFGFGTIAGGLIIGVWGGFKRRIITSLAGLFISGISIIGLGFTTVNLFFFGIAAAFLIALGFTFRDAPLIALFQSVIDKDMQGRVFSLIGSINGIAQSLGLAIAGPVADAMGTRFLLYIAGAAVIAIGITCIFIPSIMNLENYKPDESSQLTTQS